MLQILEKVLDDNQRQQIIDALTQDNDHWQDGKLTAGASAKEKKNNWQLSRDHPAYAALANTGMAALKAHPVFMSAALPKTFMPPLFSQYGVGQEYGLHVDNALQTHPDTQQWLRTDLSLTLFLNAPEDYVGGELVIADDYGEHAVKLAAGDAVLYPSTSLHRVNSVQSGQRLAMVTWVQSLVRSDEQRQILHDLDISHILLRQKLQHLNHQAIDNGLVADELDNLNKSYHNLLRLWAEC
ncbi:Fe2+-dependent dioxygenase [uncultured Psychrobacter sp.]|uniref:Fe2+-dependent dioxygenase n=1 Tax=uncultured Psychrobacter sp. TaxID=259303 RepID=UPI0034593BB8